MDLRYVYSDQPIAEGERVFFYESGRLYVRTGLVGATADAATYRLREVYDASATTPTNHPPVAGDVSFTGDVTNG